jgi:hypothetical protein
LGSHYPAIKAFCQVLHGGLEKNTPYPEIFFWTYYLLLPIFNSLKSESLSLRFISSAFGAVSLSAPGGQAVAFILVNSVFSGAANAFPMLRVGIVARCHCASLVLTVRPLTAETNMSPYVVINNSTPRSVRKMVSSKK